MRRGTLVLIRRVSLVLFCVLILDWIGLVGGTIILGFAEGRSGAIRFLRAADGAAMDGAWDPLWGAVKVVTLLLFTFVSGIVAVRTRKRLASL